MARVAAQLTNFTAGELSPRLDGRNDLSGGDITDVLVWDNVNDLIIDNLPNKL